MKYIYLKFEIYAGLYENWVTIVHSCEKLHILFIMVYFVISPFYTECSSLHMHVLLNAIKYYVFAFGYALKTSINVNNRGRVSGVKSVDEINGLSTRKFN